MTIVILDDFLDEYVNECFTMQELGRVEVTHKAWHTNVEKGVAWNGVAARAVPGIDLRGLLNPAASTLSRKDVKELLAAVRRAVFAHRQPLRLDLPSSTKQLCATLRAAHLAADAALASGRAARVFVGSFEFPDDVAGRDAPPELAASVAISAAAGGWSRLYHVSDLQGWHISAPFPVSLPTKQSQAVGRRLRRHSGTDQLVEGENAGDEEELLDLRLAWKGSSTLISVLPRGVDITLYIDEASRGGMAGRGRPLEFDICAIRREPLLRTRSTVVRVNGGWSKTSGVCAASFNKVAFTRTLMAGLPCVVSLRDAGPQLQGVQHLSGVHALHLEASAAALQY